MYTPIGVEVTFALKICVQNTVCWLKRVSPPLSFFRSRLGGLNIYTCLHSIFPNDFLNRIYHRLAHYLSMSIEVDACAHSRQDYIEKATKENERLAIKRTVGLQAN